MEQPHSASTTVSLGAELLVSLPPEQSKKKRGRPKKKFTIGDATGGSETGHAGQTDVEITFKRRRGRPIGSGSSLSPQIITVRPGQDVMAVIRVFPSHRNRAVCVLAAYGVLQSAMLCVPKGPLGVGRAAAKSSQFCVQGTLQILTFTGAMFPHEATGAGASGLGAGAGDSSMDVDRGGASGEHPRMSISLINEEGALQAGCVSGPLIAGGPVQLVLATFRHGNAIDDAGSGAPSASSTGMLAMPPSQPPQARTHPPLLPQPSRELDDVPLGVEPVASGMAVEPRHPGGHVVRQTTVRLHDDTAELRGEAPAGLFSLFGAGGSMQPGVVEGGLGAAPVPDLSGARASMLGPRGFLGHHEGSAYLSGDKGGLERLMARQAGRGDSGGGETAHAMQHPHHMAQGHGHGARGQGPPSGLERYQPHQFGGGHPRAQVRHHQVSTYDKETFLAHAPQDLVAPQWRLQPSLPHHHQQEQQHQILGAHGALQQQQHLQQQQQQQQHLQQHQLPHRTHSEPAFSEDKRMQWRNSCS